MPLTHLARDKEELVTATAEASVRELARLMRDQMVGCVLIEGQDKPGVIMTERGPRRQAGNPEPNGEPIGIVTDRDLAVKILAEDRDPDGLTAGDVMTESPVTVGEDDNVFTLCAQMRQHDVRRVPVVDDDGKMTGIISLDDIIVRLEDEIDKIEQISNDMAAVIESESPPLHPE
jgi:CBS domain-containing protein